MLTQVQQKFLRDSLAAALAANHVWPGMAAAEAALESSWGFSKLAREANNLFGQKQSHPPVGDSISIATQEYKNGEWVTESAEWRKFSIIQECFEARMDLLKKLAPEYPHYAAALACPNPEEYATEVSKSWSTDPGRALKCISIYRSHKDILHG